MPTGPIRIHLGQMPPMLRRLINTASASRFAAIAIGLASGALIALPAVMAAVASGGAGHGDYVAARALFPVPMLLTHFQNDRIGALSIAAGLLQYPFYGALLGWSVARKNYLPAFVVIVAHMIAASVCFAGTLPNFT